MSLIPAPTKKGWAVIIAVLLALTFLVVMFVRTVLGASKEAEEIVETGVDMIRGESHLVYTPTSFKSLNTRYFIEHVDIDGQRQQILFDQETYVQCIRPKPKGATRIENNPWSCVKL